MPSLFRAPYPSVADNEACTGSHASRRVRSGWKTSSPLPSVHEYNLAGQFDSRPRHFRAFPLRTARAPLAKWPREGPGRSDQFHRSHSSCCCSRCHRQGRLEKRRQPLRHDARRINAQSLERTLGFAPNSSPPL